MRSACCSSRPVHSTACTAHEFACGGSCTGWVHSWECQPGLTCEYGLQQVCWSDQSWAAPQHPPRGSQGASHLSAVLGHPIYVKAAWPPSDLHSAAASRVRGPLQLPMWVDTAVCCRQPSL